MNLLLDTHLLLWAASDPPRLSDAARHLIEDEQNILHFSVASLWEIVIRGALQREDFNVDASLLRRGLNENGYNEISIEGSHAIAVSHLPPIHRDPFDRILIAQAQVDGLALLTVDADMAGYGSPVRLVN